MQRTVEARVYILQQPGLLRVAGSVVHDNLASSSCVFPLELSTGFSASRLTAVFSGGMYYGGAASPVAW